MMSRQALDKAKRLTSGNAPLNIRRKHLTNVLRQAAHCVQTSIDNWPAEYELPKDHPLFELLEVIGIVCDDVEKGP